MKEFIKYFFSLLFFSLMFLKSGAQLTISGQLRTRAEFRDGVGTLKPKSYTPAFVTSQRTRLTFNYKMRHVIFQASLQDVRVWGQDPSTTSEADGKKLGLHEAWGEIALANKEDSSFKNSAVDYFAIKIGRQELIYDDSRLLGNSDWSQQSRRHDAIVFKLLQKGWQLDLGLAFNQNTDALNYNGTYYTPANVQPYIKDSKGNLAATPASFIPFVNANGLSGKNGLPALEAGVSSNGSYQDYKALEYLYIAKTFHKVKLSGFFLADHFGRNSNDSIQNISGTDTGYIYGKHFNQKGVNSRITTGIYSCSYLDNRNELGLIAAFYYQAGKDRNAQKISAYTSSISLVFTKRLFAYTVGWDYLSGNNAFSSSTTNHRFDPLYGTSHKTWGLMDYFYVNTGSPAGGLNNPYAKVKYTGTGKRLCAGLDYNYFNLAREQKNIAGDGIKKYLGSEVDLYTSYALNKITSLEYGFSIMSATHSMEYAKAISPGAARLTGLWSYIMISIKPEFLFK